MADIYGRSLSRGTGVTFAAVKKLIRDAISKISGAGVSDDTLKKAVQDEISTQLNLVVVSEGADPGEIVIFGDNTGKIKTSNISLNDILTRQSGAAEDSIALYTSDGRLKPGEVLSTITNLVEMMRKSLNDVVSITNSTRRNITSKFFGSPVVISMTLSDIKLALDGQKTTNEDVNKLINDFKFTLDVQRNTNIRFDKFIGDTKPVIDRQIIINKIITEFISETTIVGKTYPQIVSDIATLLGYKKILDNFFDPIARVAPRLDIFNIRDAIKKVKIPHNADAVSNVVYTVDSGTFSWDKKKDNNRILISNKFTGVPGCYRFTIVHYKKFNLEFSIPGVTGVNTVTYMLAKMPPTAMHTPVGLSMYIRGPADANDTESLPWLIEFLCGVPVTTHKDFSSVG